MGIEEVPINNQSNWRDKHTQSVLANYGKSPFFETSRNVLAEMYDRELERLINLNTCCVTRLSEVISIETVHYARDFTLPDEPTWHLLQLCVNFGATTYLSGAGGKGYLDTEPAEKAGIRAVY